MEHAHPTPGLPENHEPKPGETASHVVFLSPVFEDWAAAEILLRQLDEVLEAQGKSGRAVFINDSPACPLPRDFPARLPRKLESVRILELRRNLGHQRALCVGLVHLHQAGVRDAIVILDADGEDSPGDIPVLLREYERQGGAKVIFAARAKRTEGPLFKTLYHLYRGAHRWLVGRDIRIGNFSIVPPAALESLIVAPELWNHYAAAVVKTKIPNASVPVDRAKRLAGRSKMGFVGLVVHGLSAMSVFGEAIGVRLLVASVGLAALTLAFVFAVVAIRFLTPFAIPGWATYATGLLLVLLAQWLLLSLIFTFVVLHSRGQNSFVPLRDCPVYIKEMRTVFDSRN